MGIRPQYDGLMIDPCISDKWDGFTVTRKVRGDTYNITVTNPDHVMKGVKSITVDGKPLAGNVLPVYGDKAVHEVQVVMG